MSDPQQVGIIGATSLVGSCVMTELKRAGWRVTAFTRQKLKFTEKDVTWHTLPLRGQISESIPYWICVSPIWVVPEYFQMFESCGARKVLVLSSTSRFTKIQSTNFEERLLAQRLVDAEMVLQNWAKHSGLDWVILRPTLIYGLGQDKNVAEIARVIKRFRFFPLLGKAQGLRQPIHVKNVAVACCKALFSQQAVNHAYNISGSEQLTYQQMVSRIFEVMGKRPMFLHIPLWIFSLGIKLIKFLPKYRSWTSSMAERMNMDMAFDHTEAIKDFGFIPKAFELTVDDIP